MRLSNEVETLTNIFYGIFFRLIPKNIPSPLHPPNIPLQKFIGELPGWVIVLHQLLKFGKAAAIDGLKPLVRHGEKLAPMRCGKKW